MKQSKSDGQRGGIRGQTFSVTETAKTGSANLGNDKVRRHQEITEDFFKPAYLFSLGVFANSFLALSSEISALRKRA